MQGILETERLWLRRLEPDDVAAYHAAVYGDADVMRYLPGGVPRRIEQTARLISAFNAAWERDGFGAFGVVLKADGALIGHCGLTWAPVGDAVELFYAIGKAYWGRGLTTEAARAVLRFGFETVGLERVIALAAPENIASRRVMEKLGMRHAGMTRRYYDAELAYYVLERRAFEGT